MTDTHVVVVVLNPPFRHEGDQAQPVGEELVLEHARVVVDCHQVDRHRGDLFRREWWPQNGVTKHETKITEVWR